MDKLHHGYPLGNGTPAAAPAHRESASTGGRDGPTVMPFGKHRGVPLTQVPAAYLLWLLEEFKPGDWLRRAAHKELLRRANRRLPYRKVLRTWLRLVQAGSAHDLPTAYGLLVMLFDRQEADAAANGPAEEADAA